MKEVKCGEKCYECICCKGKRLCCSCDWNAGYHACVKWKRGSKDENGKSGKRFKKLVANGLQFSTIDQVMGYTTQSVSDTYAVSKIYY